jgi:arylsulfatase A-like enzyme
LPDVSVSEEAPQHILCLVIDALRFDAVDKEVTPFLNELTGPSAVSPATWTYPSVSSLHTGQYPHTHGAMRRSDDPENFTPDEVTFPPKIPDSTHTLPEFLAGAGYETFGAFGIPVPFLAMQGRFRHHLTFSWNDNVTAEQMMDEYISWLQGREHQRTFAYLHLTDLHAPVNPPKKYWEVHDVDSSIPAIQTWQFRDGNGVTDIDEYRENRKQLYIAALDYVDDQIRSLYESIQEYLGNITLVVTGDHGEAFWEHERFDEQHFFDARPAHCVSHGTTPYESIARVPLLSNDSLFSEAPSSLIDIMPTILNEVGITIPESVEGEMHGSDIPDDRVLLIEASRHGHEKKAVYKSDLKLLASRGDDQYHGCKIPEETFVSLPNDVESELRKELPAWPDDARESRHISGRLKTQLEDLGYA